MMKKLLLEVIPMMILFFQLSRSLHVLHEGDLALKDNTNTADCVAADDELVRAI